jgi:hypothetical protein
VRLKTEVKLMAWPTRHVKAKTPANRSAMVERTLLLETSNPLGKQQGREDGDA